MNVLLYLANQCEDVEALATRALLVRSGLEVKTLCAPKSKHITTAFGLEVICDYTWDEVDVKDYAMLIIPGGKYVAQTIESDAVLPYVIKQFDTALKPIAAICAGPRFLGRAGLLKNEHYTAFPGSEQDLEGVYHKDQKVMVDGRFITARSAGAVYEFALAIVTYLQGPAQADWLKENILL